MFKIIKLCKKQQPKRFDEVAVVLLNTITVSFLGDNKNVSIVEGTKEKGTKSKSAKAVTDLMLGLMDLKIGISRKQ